jgi:hypothetical protein
VPWAFAALRKGQSSTDLTAIDAILRSRVVLCEVVPTTLYASQPYILVEHVRYYLGDEWEYTGRTAADRHSVLNRFPLVLPDQRGNLRIVAGHHRAAAALISGQPLLARTRPGIAADPTALTVTVQVKENQDPGPALGELRTRGLSEAEILFARRVAGISEP